MNSRAKLKTERPLIRQEPVLGLAKSSARNFITSWVEEKGIQYFRSIPGLGHSKVLVPRIGFAEETEYRLCMEDEETAEYVLCTFPEVTRIRFSELGKLTPQPEDLKEIFSKRKKNSIRKLHLEAEL